MMRICRFIKSSMLSPQMGLIEGLEIHPLHAGETLETINHARTLKPIALEEVRLLPPVRPSKIVCVGRNYLGHARELGNTMPEEPLLFLKPPSSVIGPEEFIELPESSIRVEHEGELAVVIGRKAKFISLNENPLDYVLGYTCANDVTARDLQRKDVQFTRAKSFDTFCPIGPSIVCGLEPFDVKIETFVQDTLRQRGRTSEMAFSVPSLVRYISQIMTLEIGDLILTGTPAGVGPLLEGESVTVEIEGIGSLHNSVRKRKDMN